MNEDMILPDDFSMDTTPTETPEPVDVPNESVESEATPQATEETPAETPQQQLLRVKYNKEEREIPIDEAIPLVQKGLNYDKVQERLQALESDPRLNFVEQMANQFGMSADEYIQAVQQQQEQERIQQLVEQGISQELAQEMLDNRKFREQFEAEKKAKQQEEQKNVEFQDFFRYFNQANGRDFNADTDAIPPSVWEATEKGIPLKYAYMEHQNQVLQQQLQTLKQNKANEEKAPVGSLTAHGSTETASEDPFLMGFNSIK
jgi:hypothetical protein